MGSDGIGHPALPVGEFFHPLSLLSLAILLLNDWFLKPSSWAPESLTGKLSDFAGLLFFPLLLTALTNTMLLALNRLGLSCDFTLRRYKLLTAIIVTALVFTVLKLVPAVHDPTLRWLQSFGLNAQMMMDPSDLVAFVSFFGTWKIGMVELSRVPLGRIERITKADGNSAKSCAYELQDVLQASRDTPRISQLIDSIDNYLESPNQGAADQVNSLLNQIRQRTP